MRFCTVLLFALSLFPLTAGAQTHVSADPDPDSRGCQNTAAAVHENGDVVMVDYHGKWMTHPDGVRAQNGGPDYRACQLERIVRRDSAGRVVWSVEPGADRSALGFSNADRIAEVVARPDGSTVVSSYRSVPEDGTPVLTLLEPDGSVRWTFGAQQSPKFGMASVHIGDGGEIFAQYEITHYNYAGGQLQLPGGKVWKLGKIDYRAVFARIDPDSGKLLWEKPPVKFGVIVDASDKEILTVETRVRRGETTDSRFRIVRYDYRGQRTGTGETPWMVHEGMRSAIRHNDRLVMTTERETVRDGRVKHRIGRLHVFSFDGKRESVREVSDGSVLAEVRDGAPLRLVSPTDCQRGITGNYGCMTNSIGVLTLETPDAAGSWSTISVPAAQFDYRDLDAVSLKDGLWLIGKMYQRRDGAPEGTGASVTVMYSADATRMDGEASRQFVWTPIPRRESRSAPAISF